MSRKFNIAIDIDGVLRDVVFTAVRLYNKTFAAATGRILTPEDVTEYNFANSFTELKDPVKWIFEDNIREVLLHSPAFSGVYNAVLQLSAYCNITFLSKQPSEMAQYMTTKWLWNKGLGGLANEITFFCDHKRDHTDPYDIVVDDYPDNFRNMRHDQMAVLIDAPYNRSFDPNNYPGMFPANLIRFKSLIDFSNHFCSFIGGPVNSPK